MAPAIQLIIQIAIMFLCSTFSNQTNTSPILRVRYTESGAYPSIVGCVEFLIEKTSP